MIRCLKSLLISLLRFVGDFTIKREDRRTFSKEIKYFLWFNSIQISLDSGSSEDPAANESETVIE